MAQKQLKKHAIPAFMGYVVAHKDYPGQRFIIEESVHGRRNEKPTTYQAMESVTAYMYTLVQCHTIDETFGMCAYCHEGFAAMHTHYIAI